MAEQVFNPIIQEEEAGEVKANLCLHNSSRLARTQPNRVENTEFLLQEDSETYWKQGTREVRWLAGHYPARPRLTPECPLLTMIKTQ